MPNKLFKIGIYKITSPNNKVYIGRALNLSDRYSKYRRLECKRQPKLYNSLKKYGFEAHKFEIIEECNLEQLNEREVYYKQLELNKVNEDWNKVLFLQLIDSKGGCKREETKRKIGEGNRGKIVSKESRLKMSESHKGKKASILTREKMSKVRKDVPKSEEHKQNISKANKGKPRANLHRIAVRKTVIQLNKKDEPIKEWACKRLAAEWIKEQSGRNSNIESQIKDCCLGRQKSVFGYKWKYK